MKHLTPDMSRSTRRTVLLAAGCAIGALLVGAPGHATAPTDIVLEDFGGVARRGHDNTAAFRRAFAAASRTHSTLRLGAGTYEVASAALLRDGAIRRPSNVALVGAGEAVTTIQVTGKSLTNQLFDAAGSSNVATRHIAFVGNGKADPTAPYSGAFMAAVLSAGARSDARGLEITDCRFDNFASAAWLLIENQSSRFSIRDIRCFGCSWRSRAGNAPRPGAITVPAHFIYINGYAGPIEGIAIDDRLMHAAHIKGGVALVGNISGGSVRIDRLANAGALLPGIAGGADGPGSYAVMLYGTRAGVPRELDVSIGQLVAPYSVGIYSASARNNRYRIETASGQRDTRDATLTKGIVAIQSGRELEISLGEVTDCNRVVMVSIDGGQDLGAAAASANIVIDVGHIASRKGARDIVVDAGGSAIAGGVTVRGRRSGPASVGVFLRSDPKTILRDIDIGEFSGEGATRELALGPGKIDISRVRRRVSAPM